MQLFGGVISITGITFFMFSIFAIIAVGFALGRITIKGISLLPMQVSKPLAGFTKDTLS